MRTFTMAVALVLATIGSGVYAATPVQHENGNRKLRPLTATCVQKVASYYGLHRDILFAILLVEGGTVGRDNSGNTNGTYDIGPFQINSSHRKTIKELGISEDQLRDDGCVNATVAAWHLKRVLTQDVISEIKNEDDYLRAIARYHSATPEYNKIYANKLKNAFNRMYSGDQK